MQSEQQTRPVTAIRPRRKHISLDLRHLWRYRELLYFFAWRDLKVRYKQSLVGATWAVIQPLGLMLVFTIFFGRLANISSDGSPRPVFYYSALLPWTYFANAITASMNSLVSNAGLLNKIYFPRLVLPISSILAGVVDFAIAFVVLVGMLVYYATQGTTIEVGLGILMIPAFIVLMMATALAVGLWLSTLYAKYRDVRYVTPFLIQFWLFASPVAYPSSLVPERWRALYSLNPMAGVIEGFRWALTGRGQAPGVPMAISAGVVLALLLFGAWRFRRFEGTAADVI